jgi:hypothetical protein
MRNKQNVDQKTSREETMWRITIRWIIQGYGEQVWSGISWLMIGPNEYMMGVGKGHHRPVSSTKFTL